MGMPEKKASKAASPPAEAPMPTIGKLVPVEPGGPAGSAGKAAFFIFLAGMVFSREFMRKSHNSFYYNNLFLSHLTDQFPGRLHLK
jgi:hypothetical protein